MIMIGAVGFMPEDLTYHELSQAAAGANPERFHKPTIQAISDQRKKARGRGRVTSQIKADEAPQAFFASLRKQFVKE